MLWRTSLAILLAVFGAGAQEAFESDLDIVRLELLDSPNGFAIPEDSVFLPGEQVFVAFNITGYRFTEDYQVKITYRITTKSPLDKAFAMAEGGEWELELAPEDDGWEPLVKYTANLPPHAGSGVYHIDIEVTDHVANKTVTRRLPVRVEGDDVETSESLTVRNFAFSLTEGGTPIDEPTVRSGEKLWASFYITGYITGSDNAYDVESEMRIINSEGKTMLDFEPRGEKGQPFYPRLWLPASFRLDLEPSTPSGTYTVILNVRDKLGKTEYQREERFTVR